MAKASRTISHIEEQMSQNAIIEMWTETRGFKVYTAYGIDKLKFSFIEKGAQGKGNSFDIYMECLRDGTQCFDNWAYDILHGRFEKALYAEKQAGEKYPKAFKYVTGEVGEKTIGIMNSSSNTGYCINASIPNPNKKNKDDNEPAKLYCNFPVSFHDLRHLAERYLDSYSDRKKELEEIRKKASQRKNEKEPNNSEATTQDTAPIPKEEPKASKEARPVSEKKEKKPTPKTTAVEYKTKSVLSEDGKGNYTLSVIDIHNNISEMIFPKEYWKSDKYGKVGQQFKDKASKSDGIMVTLHFFVYNNKKYVAKIGK